MLVTQQKIVKSFASKSDYKNVIDHIECYYKKDDNH